MAIKLKELPHKTLMQLCRYANSDRDIATITWLGECEETSQGAVIVIKGAEAARVVAAHLERLKLYTPGLVSDQNAQPSNSGQASPK
jgi:hypothetical protein